jgi:hypothetical protein
MRNSPIVHRCAQQTDEWRRLHIGIPTASNFHRILTPTGRRSDQRGAYMCRLIAERLLKEYLPNRAVTEEGNSPYWVNRGIDMEPLGLAAFENAFGVALDRVGFVTTPNAQIGCSPDGLVVGKNEAAEVKSPAPWTQMEYLLGNHREPDGRIWKTYKPQVQGQLLIGQWDCVHFYSYHPRMPAKYVFTEPDLAYIRTLRDALGEFLHDLESELARAKDMGTYIPVEQILEAAK